MTSISMSYLAHSAANVLFSLKPLLSIDIEISLAVSLSFQGSALRNENDVIPQFDASLVLLYVFLS